MRCATPSGKNCIRRKAGRLFGGGTTAFPEYEHCKTEQSWDYVSLHPGLQGFK